jgi:UDP-N-acetylmuramoylalanine--D-glutamate ligase
MKKKIQLFRGTTALVMGLGLHGGGVATVKWLIKNGATVTATDKRSADVLAPSLRALARLSVRYVLGEHREDDFESHDLVVVNPGVPRESPYIHIAKKAGKRIENDASLFFRYVTNPIIAVTGTRGKTTTTQWIAALLQKKFPDACASGNTPENAFLKEFDRVNGKDIPGVAEMSSWQLEYLPSSERAPHIAAITNIFPDHLNRYNGIEDYADAKANIFKDQSAEDILILNFDNAWTTYFLKKKPKSRLFFVSKKPLPKGTCGAFVRDNMLVIRKEGFEHTLFSVARFIDERGVHNLENLLFAVLAVYLFDPTVSFTERLVRTLPTPRMRQELVFAKGKISVVNDSCATSPDGVIAAVERFRKLGNIVLITGGTDKELEFAQLATVLKKHIPLDNLIFLEGSATTKLLTSLAAKKMSRLNLDKKVQKNLDSCVSEALHVAKTLKGKTTILFSPGAASFEKFLHEFDRGEKFNALVHKLTK